MNEPLSYRVCLNRFYKKVNNNYVCKKSNIENLSNLVNLLKLQKLVHLKV